MVVETGPPDETYEDNVEYLIDTLPGFMENDESSGNWHLLAPIGNQIDELESDIQSISRATTVQEADTIEQLNKHADMVGESQQSGEGKEHFRSRLFARFQLNTAEGTAADIINSVATILDVERETIIYRELSQEATVELVMPKSAIDALNLTSGELAEILNDLVPAGYEIFGKAKGTFLYVSPTTYNNTDNWSLYDGYDGLDSNGDPKGNGGTYAGIVN